MLCLKLEVPNGWMMLDGRKEAKTMDDFKWKATPNFRKPPQTSVPKFLGNKEKRFKQD